MQIYIPAFALSLLLAALSVARPKESGFNNKPQPFLYCLSGIVLVAVLALREGVGTDYYDVYVRNYNIIAAGGASRFELGFTLLIKTLLFLGFDYHSLFFVCAALTVGLVYLAIYTQTNKTLWALFIFMVGGLFFATTNMVRQAISIAILLNGLPFALRRQPLPYFALVALAASFHLSAVIFVVFYFLTDWRPYSIKSVIVLAITVMFAGSIVSQVLIIASRYSSQVAAYMNNEQLSQTFLVEGNYDLADLLICAFPLIIYFYTAKNIQNSIYYHVVSYSLLYLFVGVLSCILSGKVFLLSRMAAYFSPFCILAVPQLFDAIDDAGLQEGLLIKMVTVVFFCCSCYYLFGILNFSNVLPYVSVFDKL
ncbi:MAG: EpsG family protein [Olsenella sp.]|nr:EpsG family protein [Olsenella sp.]MCI1645860.1 EpsG family protein [Olsenella sp.]MCI1810762.1 EpsG family protein [Olsenella sp.]